MLTSLGVSYVLAGHSERRVIFGEDDAAVNKKVRVIGSFEGGALFCSKFCSHKAVRLMVQAPPWSSGPQHPGCLYI